MKTTTIFQKSNCIIICIGLALCMLIGSFFDYQISSALYDPLNKFGIFLASFGQMPAMLCCSIGGILLVRNGQEEIKLTKRIGSYIGGILLHVIAIVGISMDPILHMKSMNSIVCVLLAIIIVVGVDYFVLKLVSDTDRRMIKKVIIVLVGTMLMELILINVIKVPWGRPRMRLIMIEEQAVFQPWWVIGSEVKTQLMALGISGEEFKSFPSGHTGNATCAILLGILPLINAKFKGKENLLFFTGLGFGCLVALSRILVGAHFLSDVTIGMGVTFLISSLLVHKIFAEELRKYNR